MKYIMQCEHTFVKDLPACVSHSLCVCENSCQHECEICIKATR